jgi:hypothetical protein
MKNKLQAYYDDSPMKDWMLRYERISFHELAQNRNIKPKYDYPYTITSYRQEGTLR